MSNSHGYTLESLRDFQAELDRTEVISPEWRSHLLSLAVEIAEEARVKTLHQEELVALYRRLKAHAAEAEARDFRAGQVEGAFMMLELLGVIP